MTSLSQNQKTIFHPHMNWSAVWTSPLLKHFSETLCLPWMPDRLSDTTSGSWKSGWSRAPQLGWLVTAPSLCELYHLTTAQPRLFHMWAQNCQEQPWWANLNVQGLMKLLLGSYLMMLYSSKTCPSWVSRAGEIDSTSWWVKWQSHIGKGHTIWW